MLLEQRNIMKQSKFKIENDIFDSDDELIQTINNIMREQPELFPKTKKA